MLIDKGNAVIDNEDKVGRYDLAYIHAMSSLLI
jgi:hypothetical protein